MVVGPPLVVTMGEPSGIGPEIAALAWKARREAKLLPFLYLGDMADLAARIRQCGIVVPLRESTLADTAADFGDALPVINIPLAEPSVAGRPSPANAAAVAQAITTAVGFCQNGQAAGMITGPIQKSTLLAAGFAHPGHTEMLGALAAESGHSNTQPVMMLTSDELRVVPVTVHCPLREVPLRLTQELIISTIRIVVAEMKNRFGFHAPRLAVCGLNPHAGEDGKLGREEIDVIQPALEALRREGVKLRGPLSADTMFHPQALERYDVAVCMYHDQALIPIKALAFDRAVNVTLGLPFVRTSPDHGTALELAGSGKANPSSMIEAIKLAGQLAETSAQK